MVNIIIKAYQKTFREKLHLKCKTNLIDGKKKYQIVGKLQNSICPMK